MADRSGTARFDFHDIGKILLILNDLGYDVPTLYHYLEKYTGIPAANTELFGTAVYERLFCPAISEEKVKYPFLDVVSSVINELPKKCLKDFLAKGFAGLRKVFGVNFYKIATELALAAVRLG